MDSVIGDIAIDISHLWARGLAQSYFARDFLRFVFFVLSKNFLTGKQMKSIANQFFYQSSFY